MSFRALFLVVSLFLFTAPAAALEPPHNTTARLFAAVEGVDALKTLPVGVEVKLNPGWKSYWRTPGEAGLAPVFNWAGSSNLKEAKILWPAPKRFVTFDIDNFGYEKEVTFPIEITPEAAGKPVDLKLKLDLLVCNELCVPESHTLSLSIPSGDARVSPDQSVREKALATVPSATGDEAFSVANVWVDEDDSKKIMLHAFARAAAAPAAAADFFVESKTSVSIGAPTFDYNAAARELRIDAPVRSADTLDSLRKSLGAGPLTLTYVSGDAAFERTAALGAQGQPPQPVRSAIRAARAHVDLSILLLALVGGLILNLMPCVLPVLSIKVLSVLSHGGKDHHIHRATIFRNFMASAAGIVFSFWLMAGMMVALKNAGATIGWGIQFQHPAFLIVMIAVLILFAVNMWGVFEIPLPRLIAKHMNVRHEQEPTLLGHFLTGAFATLLATPCTAPFLGTAVGFALAREAFDIFIVFTFMGLGLALPYLALALSPRVFKYMPKPGRWMMTFKKFLALVLALTAGWLINVLVVVTTQPTLDDGWTEFNEALIAPAVREGRTVVVDVTADWCLTCKANKRLVFEQKEVEDALYAPNVLRLQADWTHHDEKISAYLQKYGRYGIPFNIIYGPGMPDGVILSELPSKRDVMRALEEAAGE